MTLHVDIGDAKTRLSELVAAAVCGEEVVLDKAGSTQVRLVPVEQIDATAREARAAKRRSAIGMYADRCAGLDLDIEALKSNRMDSDERYERKLGVADRCAGRGWLVADPNRVPDIVRERVEDAAAVLHVCSDLRRCCRTFIAIRWTAS